MTVAYLNVVSSGNRQCLTEPWHSTVGAAEIWWSASIPSPQWCSVELSNLWVTVHSTVTVVVVSNKWWNHTIKPGISTWAEGVGIA